MGCQDFQFRELANFWFGLLVSADTLVWCLVPFQFLSNLVFCFQFLSTMKMVFQIILPNAFHGFSGFAKEVYTPQSC